MKQSKYFLPTLKEVPSDANVISHVLMLRAGLIRPLASGVFSFLPIGFKVLNKIINIIREEMNKIDGLEFLLPALNPKEIWEQTGRVEAMGDVMFHIKNREELILAPTHEEIITYHAKQNVKSYRDMPMIWYQIQTKFRNEPRPKSGVLRGRQFIMKDAYSMDSTWEGLDQSYQKHYEAYCSIFNRCNIKFFVVGASSGAMGGKQSQEFMVESNSGEDTCAVCDSCGYAANVEVASSNIPQVGRIDENLPYEEFSTPNAKTIDDLIEQYNLPEERCAKSVVYMIDDKPVLIFMRGNDELNETKLQTVFGTNNFRPAEAFELVQFTGADHGSIGPINLKEKITVVADLLLKDANGLVSGANKDGFHFKNIDFARDCKIDEYYDFRTVKEGEKCPNCDSGLRVVKAIELGHIFKLGTKYSDALGANFLDSEGKEHPIIMGSYGIGVERVLACFLENSYDDKGIVWQYPLSPFDFHLISVNPAKSPEAKEVADKLYKELSSVYDILYDDREESAGVKFNDADLVGIPMQVIVGSKNLKDGNVEIKYRATGERKLIKIDEIQSEITNFIKK